MISNLSSGSGQPRYPGERGASSGFSRSGLLSDMPPPAAEAAHLWLVDLGALVRCRQLLAGHGSSLPAPDANAPAIEQSPMEIPAAYDAFCHTHFASVRRLHPELSWDDACPAYAIALSAHASLCVTLDEERELQLQRNWPAINGGSHLSWAQARGLIADGCSALDRLDPLSMHRR